ncbi:MAG: leucine-rich repeat domain-containing protein [Clostridia bacterium]|nr:leucine-rich repeat domain-containing protein [Clostridia bacterium]
MMVKKKIVVLLIAAVLFISTAPLAFAETPYVIDSGISGNLSWSLDSAYTLEISGKGKMGMYSNTYYNSANSIFASSAPWGKYYSEIESIVISKGVTSIGSYAFSGCSSLKSVDISDSVTTIGEGAFYLCKSLTNITIPDSVNSIYTIAFMSCYDLSSVKIGNGVKCIESQAFSNCTSLSTVKLGNSLNSIGGYAFEDCRSIKNISIPNSVMSIDIGAFQGCTSLESILVNEGNLYYLTDDSGCLYNKDKTLLVQYPIGNDRTKYTIPDSVNEIDFYAFSECSSLTQVDIGNGVTIISPDAFSRCDSLSSVTFGEKVQFIGENAFYGCSSLAAVDLPAAVKEIESLSFPDIALKDITIRSRKCSIAEDAISLNATIHGYTGSSAEALAKAYGYSFVSLGSLPECKHNVEAWEWTDGNMCIGGTTVGICILCDETIFEKRVALGHMDANGDGQCDRCNAHIKDETQSKPQQSANSGSHWYDWLVEFFRMLFNLFRH